MRRWLCVVLLVLTSCGTMAYPRLGIYGYTVSGGQRQIDQGYITDITWLPHPWLAGHRTAATAVFRRLPDARLGDVVYVHGLRFHVTGILKVPQSYTVDHRLGDLVLQTSLPGGALLVVATRG